MHFSVPLALLRAPDERKSGIDLTTGCKLVRRWNDLRGEATDWPSPDDRPSLLISDPLAALPLDAMLGDSEMSTHCLFNYYHPHSGNERNS